MCACVEWLGGRIRWRGECVELMALVVCSSSEQQVERLYMIYMILSFRPKIAPDLGWVSSLTDDHATMLRSAVSSSVTAYLCGP